MVTQMSDTDAEMLLMRVSDDTILKILCRIESQALAGTDPMTNRLNRFAMAEAERRVAR